MKYSFKDWLIEVAKTLVHDPFFIISTGILAASMMFLQKYPLLAWFGSFITCISWVVIAVAKETLIRSDAILLRSCTTLIQTQEAYIIYLKKKLDKYDEELKTLKGEGKLQ